MANNNIKTGLVGAGYIAGWHGDAIKATKGVDIAAVCDVSLSSAEALGQAYGVPAFTSLDDMIAANVCDAVHILTPPQTHKDLAITCLQAGLQARHGRKTLIAQHGGTDNCGKNNDCQGGP